MPPVDTTDTLFPIVYEELKRVARYQLSVAGTPSALSTTELVHEVFLKLSRAPDVRWEGRAHFFGAASRAMREVLVDFARRRRAEKRGGGALPVSLGQAGAALEIELDQVLALDQALAQLDAVDQRLRRVVELRFFAGLTEREVAELLGCSARTIERDWLKARLFLLRHLDGGAATS
jgi:RNA polymerase sigma factor (TIGR02999 family)